MIELQITKEYLGFATHLVYLAPLFEEVLTADTHVNGTGPAVRDLLQGAAGVANTGSSRAWCGAVFACANWHAFGRLAWNPALTSGALADEWLRMTFTNDPAFVEPVKAMMLTSRQAAVDYMTPLGLTHLMARGHHYGPGPWVNDAGRADQNSTYFHRADAAGIGFDRTAAGSNAVAQYARAVARHVRTSRSRAGRLPALVPPRAVGPPDGVRPHAVERARRRATAAASRRCGACGPPGHRSRGRSTPSATRKRARFSPSRSRKRAGGATRASSTSRPSRSSRSRPMPAAPRTDARVLPVDRVEERSRHRKLTQGPPSGGPGPATSRPHVRIESRAVTTLDWIALGGVLRAPAGADLVVDPPQPRHRGRLLPRRPASRLGGGGRLDLRLEHRLRASGGAGRLRCYERRGARPLRAARLVPARARLGDGAVLPALGRLHDARVPRAPLLARGALGAVAHLARRLRADQDGGRHLRRRRRVPACCCPTCTSTSSRSACRSTASGSARWRSSC